MWGRQRRRTLGAMLAVAVGLSTPAAATVSERAQDHVGAAVADGLEPSDLHHLVLTYAWRNLLPDWRLIHTSLDRLAATTPMDPLMADEVRSLRARIAVAEGRPEAALELFRAMGGLERWWVSSSTPLPELEDFQSAALYPDFGAGWRQVPGVDPLGWVRLSGLAWPTERRMIYVATTVASDAARPAALRLGAAQVARAWVNGVECLTTPYPMARADDQAAAGAVLRRGNNLIVVAVGTERDQWWLRVRLTEPDGSPLSGVRENNQKPSRAVAAPATPVTIRDLGEEIDRAVEAGVPGALMARAAFVVSHRPKAVGSGAEISACRTARPDAPAEARLLESMVSSEPSAVRRLLEKALENDPDLTPARVALARWYHSHDLDGAAHDLLAGRTVEPAVAAADLEIAADRWGAAMFPEMQGLSDQFPRCVEAQILWAQAAARTGFWTAAGTPLGRLLQLVPGAGATSGLEHRRAVACGDGEALLRLARLALATDPNRPEVRIELARLLVADRQQAEALEVLRQGLHRCPDQVDLLLELARLEHAAGADERAAGLARRLLELRPQSRPAERLLERLGQGTDDGGWRRTDGELRNLARQAAPAAGTVVVLDHQEVRFLPGNLVEERVQRAVRIGTAEQADSFRQETIGHVPERQRLRVLAARILREGGSELSATQDDTPRLSEPAINMFYDTRLRVVRYPELEDGDILELSYVLTETAEANESGPYKGGLVVVRTPVPVAAAEIELAGAPELLPRWELAHLSGDPGKSIDPDGTVHLRWAWHDLPAAPADRPGPPPLLVTPHLAYSNHAGWGDLAGWYARHTAPRTMTSYQVAETARRLTKNVAGRRARIAAVYRFVTDEIRYVALELGEHRYRPFSADWVLHHRMGDCKDKAALLVALLRAIDVPARMVLVRTADEGPPAVQLGLMEDFNHAIGYLPEDDLWLDGTATGHDPTFPPGPDQGAFVLVVDGADSRPETSPAPGSGTMERHVRLSRGSEDGLVALTVAAAGTGDAADRLRARYAGSRDPQRLSRSLRGLFPGAELTGDAESRLLPGSDPARIKVAGTVARSALPGANGIRSLPGNLELVAQLAPSDQRSTPLLILRRPDLVWSVEVALGRPANGPPEGARISGPFGSLELSVTEIPDGYRVDGAFHLEPGLVPPERIPELRHFLVAAERAAGRRLEIP